MSRITPFELVFGGLTDELEQIRADALTLDKDPGDRATFMQLPAALALLDRLTPPAVTAENATAVAEYLNLLYVCFRFWNAGGRVFGLPRAQVETALDQAPPQSPPVIPQGACYLQLPERWFWAQVADDAPHEPIDGLFVVEAVQRSEITLLAVLGLRTERAGFSQICLNVTTDDVVAARSETREDRFAPSMEGGTLSGFRSVVSAAELLLLTQLLLLQVRGGS